MGESRTMLKRVMIFNQMTLTCDPLKVHEVHLHDRRNTRERKRQQEIYKQPNRGKKIDKDNVVSAQLE